MIERLPFGPGQRNIAGGAEPFGDLALLAEHRNGTRLGPAGRAVHPDHSMLQIEMAFCADRPVDRLLNLAAIL